MHYIQKRILDKLRTNQALHYAELKDDEIESGHFRYHLGELVKDGYVDLLERGVYDLSQKGNSFVDKLSSHKVVPENMPKVITYTLLQDNDNIYLQQKTKQPYINLVNMIGGKVHEGELSARASVREVYEKTGMQIANPELKGIFEIQINAGSKLLTHAISYVYQANINPENVPEKALIKVPKHDIASTKNLAPDFLHIYNAITNSSSVITDTIEINI